MANNSDDYTLSENEESRYSSDENVEITQVPLTKKTRGHPAKSSKALGKQQVTSANEESLTALESSSQTSIDSSNPFVQMPVPPKPQIKSSWVWDYYIKNLMKKEKYRHIVSLNQIMVKNVQNIINMIDLREILISILLSME